VRPLKYIDVVCELGSNPKERSNKIKLVLKACLGHTWVWSRDMARIFWFGWQFAAEPKFEPKCIEAKKNLVKFNIEIYSKKHKPRRASFGLGATFLFRPPKPKPMPGYVTAM